MSLENVAARVRHIAAVRADDASDLDAVRSALADAERMRAWVEAQIAALVHRLDAVDVFPEATIAETSRCSLGAAGATKQRSETLASTPSLAEALEGGLVTPGHVDAVTRGSKKLEPAQRDEFLDRVDTLVEIAAAGTVDQFSRRLALEIKHLQRDDGEDRLERQKRATRLSEWVDDEGMWNLRGRFDPITGMRLAAKIRTATDTVFAESVPECCPSDPVEKNRFLAAHALAQLVDGAGTGPGSSRRPEFVVVIDTSEAGAVPATTDAGADSHPRASGPTVDWPIPVEVPPRVLAEIAGTADVHVVVARNGVVLHAPGNLDLGRSTRLANRAQRRALRALYRGCAVPGCSVDFERCKLHHVVWWRHGGRTDLSNLLPVCARHHTKIHQDGWEVTLGPRRQLTITLPGGRVMATGPPKRSVA